ncbi:hypothetical protein U9M48_006474 [Paspalum notatum var. saurae]|uniref:Uncharacterized protein n=1 Tax=Paspalum notatum var. saurae TaxID=547442 RepID=A0AAQ3PUF5_PASNO
MLRGERLRERGIMDEELAVAMAAAAAGSECSSGCQSGWTTYLDDHSSYSYSYSCGADTGTGTARFIHGDKPLPYRYHGDYSAEEDDLSMISDASSGPRHQSCSAGNDAEGRGARREEPAASKRRNSKRAAAAAAAASLLEDTASSPAAFFGYSKAAAAVHGPRTPNSQAVGFGELGNGYGGGGGAEMMAEIGNAADFSSYAFSTTTGFKAPLSSGTAWGGGYMQMHYPPAPIRQARRDASEKKRW